MTSALYVQTRKEVRALLPWWLGAVLATVAMSYVAVQSAGLPFFRYDQQMWLVTVYLAGVLVLAALSVGQELTHGTFAALLVQPVDRRRVLWTKIGVLAALLFALGIVAEAGFPKGSLAVDVVLRPLSIWGPVAIGIGLVPVFTLLTRKPLAGPVFALVVPGLIYVFAERYYFAGGTSGLTVAWYGTLVVSAIGFVALSFLFPRAEVAGEGLPSSPNRLAPATTPTAFVSVGPSGRKRSWVWLSIVKEVRLQQMTFAVSGLFVLLGAVIVIAQRMDPPYTGPGVGALAALHGVIVAVIAGSRASAEERHFGVLAAQALQPRAAWQQWFLKVSVTLSLVLVLAVALPWLFGLVDADTLVKRTPGGGINIVAPAGDWFGHESEYFFGVALACFAALYVSSLSSNSLWALLACLPATGVILAGTVAVQPLLFFFRRAVWEKMYQITPAMQESYHDPGWRGYFDDLHRFRGIQDDLTISLAVALALFVLYLAQRNHRTLERGARPIAIQAGLIAAILVVATATYIGASHLAWSFIIR